MANNGLSELSTVLVVAIKAIDLIYGGSPNGGHFIRKRLHGVCPFRLLTHPIIHIIDEAFHLIGIPLNNIANLNVIKFTTFILLRL